MRAGENLTQGGNKKVQLGKVLNNTGLQARRGGPKIESRAKNGEQKDKKFPHSR